MSWLRKSAATSSSSVAKTEMEGAYHIPVMLHESVEGLQIDPDGIYVDATFGGGGHSLEILNRLKSGRLLGFDQDPDARANAPEDPRFTFIAANRHAQRYYAQQACVRSTAFWRTLGFLPTTLTLLSADSRSGTTPLGHAYGSAEIPNRRRHRQYNPEEKLVQVLAAYGEVKSPRKVANRLIQARNNGPIGTTFELIDALRPVTPRQKEYRFQAQVFQSFRMEVNQELQALEALLEQSTVLIKPGGRLAVITYHSLEDRLVKHYLRTGNAEGELEKDFFGNPIRPFRPTQSKPIIPTESELNANNRSRSAKLRVAERIELPKQAR